MEKTVIDIDISHLEESDETVVLRLPPEDSDLHDLDFLQDEKTSDFPMQETSAESKPLSPPKKPPVKPKVEAPPQVKIEKPKPPQEKALPSPRPASPPEAGRPYAVLYLLLSLVVLAASAFSLVEMLHQGGMLLVPTIAVTAFVALSLLGSLLRRWMGRNAFLASLLAWFGLAGYSAYRFYTSDPESLHVFRFSLENSLGPLLVVVGGVAAWIVVGTRRLNVVSKILALLSWLILLGAAGIALAQGRPLEDSLWNPAALANLPIFLRPGVLALALAFPLLMLTSLLALFWHGPAEPSFLRRGGWAVLGIALLGTVLGARLLARQGVEIPLLGPVVQPNFFGATSLDPTSSPIRVQVSKGKGDSGRPGEMSLHLAASRSEAQGKVRSAWLMVKNPEGRSMASGVPAHLTLSRSDKVLSGVKAQVETSRLGKPRRFLLLFDMPSLAENRVKSAVAAAVLQLARQLGGHDRLDLLGVSGVETLNPRAPETWGKKLDKVLVPGTASPELRAQALKKISGDALIQFTLLSEAGKLSPEQNAALLAEATQQKAVFNIVALGLENPSVPAYFAAMPANLGFELLSAAAETLGDVRLQFPALAPLPRVKWNKINGSAQAVVQDGKVSFEVMAQEPGLIESLQLKIDEEKPIDLAKTELRQSIDLTSLKIKPGGHRFLLLARTQAGDIVSDSAEVRYATRRPLRFVKPLDKDTVAGNFNVTFSVGEAPDIETQSVDLLVDGTKVGTSTSRPFLIPLNSAKLSEGEHSLQAVQSYSNGTSESAQIQINVNQQVPQVEILRPSTGEYLPNLAEIEAQVGGGLFEQVEKVEFLVDGEWIGESLQAPYRLLWSNNAFPPGEYFIQVRAYLSSHAMVTDAVPVQLGQGEMVVQADPRSSSGGMLFPENVEVLLDASAGMNGSVGAALKLDLAKAAVADLLKTLPSRTQLNIRVLGSQDFAEQENCKDVRVLKKPASELQEVRAQGVMPLAAALELLEKNLKNAKGPRVGLLIADSWDECGGDPIAVATRLSKQEERLRLHVLYFGDVSPSSESLLKRLAEVTGGRSFKISRPEDLTQALQDAVQVSYSLYDYKNSPVSQGPLSQNPIPVRAGEYRLEIDTFPSLAKPNLMISSGTRKTLTVLQANGAYELQEE
ncbi:MAG TPA: hypothetical protein DF383_12630 [Deltaproteobacteria bacterium]|nr:hypothetical protein [Deltaproteobacteria bacterium]